MLTARDVRSLVTRNVMALASLEVQATRPRHRSECRLRDRWDTRYFSRVAPAFSASCTSSPEWSHRDVLKRERNAEGRPWAR